MKRLLLLILVALIGVAVAFPKQRAEGLAILKKATRSLPIPDLPDLPDVRLATGFEVHRGQIPEGHRGARLSRSGEFSPHPGPPTEQPFLDIYRR